MLRRHNLSTNDSEFWLGMLREILRQLQSRKDPAGG
jgi:hypothetical protein